MASNPRPVGQTKAVGFQIGARKSFAIDPGEAWALLLSPAGVDCWLGAGATVEWIKGAHYATADGTIGEIHVVSPGTHLRLTWQPPQWTVPSTVQVRVIPRGDKTVISFHQEKLAGPAARTAMQARWHGVLETLTTLIDTHHSKGTR